MQMFTEKGKSLEEVVQKVRLSYGKNATILSHSKIRYGGFLGFFEKKGYEVHGYISNNTSVQRKSSIEDKLEKKEAESNQYQELLKEISSIKSLVRTESLKPKRHPNITEMEVLLKKNELTDAFVESILSRLEKELSLDDLANLQTVQNSIIEWIGETLDIYTEIPHKKPHILILVGPTGVGKTTTIAKLAAVHALGRKGIRPKDVKILTIDNYRIGARQQIESYGEIMDIPVASVETYEELKKHLAMFAQADMILIDTIGKSPNDSMNLAEMKEILDGCGSDAEVFLAMSATTKYSDIRDIMKQYEPFRYDALVFTKLDETMRVGNVLSALHSASKRLAYITDGQSVPDNIEKATVGYLLERLQGFQINKTRINRKFSDNIVKKGPVSGLEEKALKEGWS